MSNYDYKNVVRDFALRTQKNLVFVENNLNNAEVYETTQLINSMLGLLVFPQQEFMEKIPDTPLEELEAQGWPHIKVSREIQFSPEYVTCNTLNELMRRLRNSIAHYNIEFIANIDNDIIGVRVWNTRRYKRPPKTWEVELSLYDLRIITNKFIDLLA